LKRGFAFLEKLALVGDSTTWLLRYNHVLLSEEKNMQTQVQKLMTPRMLFTALGVAVFSVLVLTTIVPVAHWIPVSVTETATVIAVTESGCVVDGSNGYPITVADCKSSPGESIEFSYMRPAVTDSQYMQRVHARADYVTP
jgi:hypothetical protein